MSTDPSDRNEPNGQVDKEDALQSDAPETISVSPDLCRWREAMPESVGPYRILEPLGEGGMGVVYLAEQTEPIRRRVAIKVIKLGMDTKQVIARFDTERQALALMNHPNVARIFDAGATKEGRPYFVMEHVDGIPITRYCDEHRLNTEERHPEWTGFGLLGRRGLLSAGQHLRGNGCPLLPEQGGSPLGPGSVCQPLQACCLGNACQDLEPNCCLEKGGSPQGFGSACTAPEPCCLPDHSCKEMDPLCCVDQGGELVAACPCGWRFRMRGQCHRGRLPVRGPEILPGRGLRRD